MVVSVSTGPLVLCFCVCNLHEACLWGVYVQWCLWSRLNGVVTQKYSMKKDNRAHRLCVYVSQYESVQGHFLSGEVFSLKLVLMKVFKF